MESSRPPRLDWLDAFRGLTIAGMILVNNPGSWSTIYAPLRHAEWDGCTPTDLVFPFFLFIAGFSMAISQARRPRGGSRTDDQLRLLRRSLSLIAVGLFLHAFPKFDWANLRIPGVLQRIGLCTLLVGTIDLQLPRKVGAMAMVAALGIYHLAFFGGSFPFGDFPSFSQADNPTSPIDLAVFGPTHVWVKGKFDPEGLLSTLTAAWNLYLGLVAGRLFLSRSRAPAPAWGFAAGAPILVLLGLMLSEWHQPLNKPLWTPSYAFFTSGLAWAAVLLLAFAGSKLRLARPLHPFIAFGRNPLLLFVLSGLLGRALSLIKVSGDTGAAISLKELLYRRAFASWLAPFDASLAYALATVLLFTLIALGLDRRRIYVRL